jgi:stage II sporulation protein M
MKKNQVKKIKNIIIGISIIAIILIVLGFFNLSLSIKGINLKWIILYFIGIFYFSFEGKPFKKCYSFLKESKWYIVFSLGIFSLVFLFGFIFPIFFRERIILLLQELMLSIEGKNLPELISFIMFNNIKASFFAMIFGIFIGIFPIITLVFNGYILGFVARETAEQQGILILWRVLPHGIFELPAIFFSVGIGLKIGIDLFNKNWKKKLKYNFKEGLRFFVFVVVPALIIAAIIEGFLIFYYG